MTEFERIQGPFNVAMQHRVGAPVPRGASHRTGLVLFTSGSSGRQVMTPAAGRLTTSRYPSGSRSCAGAIRCRAFTFHSSSSENRPCAAKSAFGKARCVTAERLSGQRERCFS
jgi:hypothetical protein